MKEYSAYDDLPWIHKLGGFIREIDAIPNIKVIGICFGHQIIAQALGGKGLGLLFVLMHLINKWRKMKKAGKLVGQDLT